MPPTTKYRQAKRFSRSHRERRKPFYQAVFAPVLTSRRAETAYAGCIKDGVFIDPACGSGSLLINIGRSAAKHIDNENNIKYFTLRSSKRIRITSRA